MTELALVLLRWLDRWPRWAAIGLPAAVAGLCATLLYDPRVNSGGDNALYWALGRSLIEQHAYLNMVAPGEPFETSVPWGLPALLAGVMVVFGDHYGALKLFSWAAMVGAFVLLGAFLQHLLRGHRGIAVLGLLICALNQRLMMYGSMVLSEAPFLALSAGALLAFEVFRNRWPDRWLGIAPAALMASYAYLVRPIGISLVAAILGALLLGRRWRALAVALLIVAAVDGSWHVRCVLHPSDEPNLYLSNLSRQSKFQTGDETVDLAGFVHRLAHNTGSYLNQPMKEMTLSHRYRQLNFQDTATVLLLLAAVGFVVTLSRAGPVHLYLPLYLLALLAWLPEVIKTRYLALVYPLLLVMILLGLWRVLALRSPRAAAFGVVALVLVLLSFNGARLRQLAPRYQAIRMAHEAGYPDAGRSDAVLSYIKLCLWVEESGRSHAILAARKPRLAYFYSGHKAVRVPYASAPDEVFSWLVDQHIDYLLLDRIDSATAKTRDRMLPTIEAYPEHFREEYRTPSGDRVLLFTATPMTYGGP